MSGWTKLFGSIVTSSIWLEDSDILRIWIAMLALADAHDIVEGTVPGFASLCRVPRETMQKAIEKFSSPDPDSRTPDNDGRRIEIVPSGWKIINRAKYKTRWQEETGTRAKYMREYRSKKYINNVTKKCYALQRNITRAPEKEKEKEIEKELKDILQKHEKMFKAAYPGINLETETAKAQAWLNSNPKNKKSNLKRFLNNWFNRTQEKINLYPPKEEKYL